MLVSSTPADPRTLIDAAPAALWFADGTGNLVHANAAWLALAGLDRLPPAGWFEGVHPDDIGRARAAWAASIASDAPLDVEYRRGGPAGYIWCRDRATPQFEEGSLVGFAGVTEDVTEQRATQSALRIADKRFKSLVDAVPASVYVVAADGSIEFCNQHWLDYAGVTLEQTRQLGSAHFVHPDDYPALAKSFAAGRRDDHQLEAEMRVRRHDGVYRWHMARSVPFEVDGERHFIGANVDVDDRRYQEDAERFLGVAGEELTSTLEPDEVLSQLARLAIPFLGEGVAIDVIDTGGLIRTAAVAHHDPQTEHLAREMRDKFPPVMGGPHPVSRCIATGREVLVQTDDRFLHDVTRDPEHLRLAAALRSNVSLTVPIVSQGSVAGTLTVYRGPGNPQYERREVASARQLARRAGMALENARLFEQLHESARALERAGTAKDEFLGLVSHELRTPLTTLKGTASVLRRHGESLSDEDKAQALKDIERGADQLQRIVENMLTLAQPELAGDDELEPMLLRRVVSSVVQEQSEQFPDRQIRLHAPKELLPVMSHPAYLRQIFQNLLGNARKYSPAGSDIDVRIQRSDGEVIVSVEDRGMGIGREAATQLFQPFFRTDEAARAQAGLGLGLTVCKRLVEHQGGRIWAEPRDGGGTSFYFAMPVLEADSE